MVNSERYLLNNSTFALLQGYGKSCVVRQPGDKIGREAVSAPNVTLLSGKQASNHSQYWINDWNTGAIAYHMNRSAFICLNYPRLTKSHDPANL